MAQAAHDYAQNLLAIAQQHSVDVTKAQSLIADGDKLLAQAQGEVSSNPAEAAQDALKAMRDYRDAAQYLQSTLLDSIKDANLAEQLQNYIQRAQEMVKKLQTIVDKVCSSSTAPQDVCTEVQNDLTQATADIQQASGLVSTDPDGAMKLLKDAAKLLEQVHADLAKLADSAKTQKAIDYVQNELQKRLSEVKDMVQKANLDPTLAATVQGQLDHAQSLLDKAVQDFKAGNFTTGVQDAQQAMQLLQQIVKEIRK
jgi:tetratricopeptide (TPR) repeat protein